MSTLEDFKLHYEDLTPKKTRKGGKAKKMAKTTNETSSSKAKKYNKTRGEHFKDILIAVLVTAIIGFVAGMQFADSNNSKVEAAVSQAETAMTAEAVETPVKK